MIFSRHNWVLNHLGKGGFEHGSSSSAIRKYVHPPSLKSRDNDGRLRVFSQYEYRLKGSVCWANRVEREWQSVLLSLIVLSPSLDQVQHALIDLLKQKLIATPLKLQLIRALDLSTRLKVGLDSFIGVSRAVKDQPARTPYQRLVYFLIEKNVNHHVKRCCHF